MSETPKSDTAAKLPAKEPNTSGDARIKRMYKEPTENCAPSMPDREGHSDDKVL